ncbi:MAG: hypothetical protein HKN94_08335, partial [Acidimicrobiales bacterium]|nr:hypothetical protein [Acidimicrobiales bacterium]
IVNGPTETVQDLVVVTESIPVLAFTGANLRGLAALALLLIMLGFAMLAYDRPALAWKRRED